MPQASEGAGWTREHASSNTCASSCRLHTDVLSEASSLKRVRSGCITVGVRQRNGRGGHQGMKGGGSVLGRMEKRGGRFSRKDVTPSAASAERPIQKIAFESTRCASIG